MHLKEIRMENFKTFRKKVSIPIYQGFTGITGPNGSGKSNVADAILFVLGPRSSKMVRAKRLQDLIFHGNDKFKPAKECKVTLVFNNTDRMIPVDRDEVSLRRIIRRSASDPDQTLSYFYVNGRSSSQSEFENILTHAHLSAEGYNIVLQGHIAEFINKTPLRIREEIDDIAGIRKYDEEIKLSQRKKEQTEDNMEKIQWHLDFIKGRLRELRKEKEEAERYREAQDRINQTKALMYTVQKEAVDGELESYNKAISNAEERKVKIREELENIEIERVKAEKETKEIEDKIADITGEEGRKLKEKLDEARLELMRAKDVIETAEDSIMELDKEAGIRDGEIKDISRKLKGLDKEKEAAVSSIKDLQASIEDRKNGMKKLEDELERSDSDLLNLRRDLGKIVKHLESKRDELSEKILERDRANAATEAKATYIADLEQMISTLTYEVKDIDEQINEMDRISSEGKVKELQKGYMEARNEEKFLGKRMRELESEITSLNRLFTQLKVELDTSEKLSKGVNMAVENILTARDTGEIKGIHGTIGELGNVPEKYSTALEVAAGGRISAVVVDDDEVAASCIDRLKKKNMGRATFLPLNKLSSRRPGAKALMVKDDPHVVGLAVDLIEFDEEYRAAFGWAFSDTVVVDSLDTLRRLMGGVRIVTLQGEIAGAGGDITGGSRMRKAQGGGFGKRSRSELDAVSKKLKEKMAESESLTGALNETREKVSELETEIRKITGDQVDTEGRKKKLAELLSGSREQLKEKEAALSEARKTVKQLENQTLELDGVIRELEKDVETSLEERDRLQEKLDQSTPKAMRDKVKALREELEGLGRKRQEAVGARDSADTQMMIFKERSSEMEKRMKDIAEAKKKAKDEMEEARKKEERYSTEVKALEKVLSSIDEKTKDLYERLNQLGREVERLLGSREKARMDSQSQDQIVITQRTNIRIAEEKMADILRELQVYNNVELPERPWPSERELVKLTRDLESILENVGNVNLKALEEYEEMERRKEEVSTEMKALEKEKKELEKLIGEINDKRRTEFMHVFDGVDQNFRKIYSHISSGGEAYFQLECPEDPLSGGLNIHVRPGPTKKMTRLGALSGGEKSLTSMAFIFAVQAWDPSPFYLLDEVDQNLDAINAEIIAEMVKNNSNFAQFVMISLRKISLKEAHHLYGVTLQNGESVILGKVDLKDVEKYEQGANGMQHKTMEGVQG